MRKSSFNQATNNERVLILVILPEISSRPCDGRRKRKANVEILKCSSFNWPLWLGSGLRQDVSRPYMCKILVATPAFCLFWDQGASMHRRNTSIFQSYAHVVLWKDTRSPLYRLWLSPWRRKQLVYVALSRHPLTLTKLLWVELTVLIFADEAVELTVSSGRLVTQAGSPRNECAERTHNTNHSVMSVYS